MKLKSAFSSSTLWCVLALAAVVLAAYWNSFSGPFIYDDLPSISDNPSVRHLWPIWPALSPPHGRTTDGRPLLNLSLAVNYALGGEKAWGYHALNLAIHFAAALALFGLARRTLRNTQGSSFNLQHSATGLAFCVALLWAIHPLQTEAVTYIVQRAESMMALFYLLTLYCFVRYTDNPTSAFWPLTSVFCCLAGMATKEVMVSAPVMVLLYDRTFVAGNFREAWVRRRRYYIALAGTWLLLGFCVAQAGANRGGTAGFDVGVTFWQYWLTQCKAIVTYLKLSVWPHPLVFEYGTFWANHVGDVLPYAAIVLPLAFGAIVALWRWPIIGFLGFWFFSILAPTSLVPGPTQMIVEHRMYLALAPLVALVVCGTGAVLRPRIAVIYFAVIAALFATLTARRNQDYRSSIAIWADTVAKRPGNAIAQYNLGTALFDAGRFAEAIPHFQEAMRLKPDYTPVRNNIGNALFRLGRVEEAVAQYQELLRLKPDNAEAHENLGNTFLQLDRMDEAVAQYRAALKLKPRNPETHDSLGNALLLAGRGDEALAEYQEALRLQPDNAKAHYDFGTALAHTGRLDDAAVQYRQALRFDPNHAAAHNNLAILLTQAGHLDEAIDHYEKALRINPDYLAAHYNLGNALLRTGRTVEAMDQYREVLRLDPNNAAAREMLARIQATR